MPKPKRTPEEIEAIKEGMLEHATDLICDQGYKGFSMRKLAARLGIAAKTIYNYYHNKDEIYLAILTKGFERLYDSLLAAQQSHPEPLDQLRAMTRAYLDFGLENSNLYSLMFTWVVPKYKDYVGTEMEPIAQVELETALKPPILFIETIKACAACSEAGTPLSDEEARIIMIQFWTQAHGYVAGINNTLMDYMHEDPLSLKERMLDTIMANLERTPES